MTDDAAGPGLEKSEDHTDEEELKQAMLGERDILHVKQEDGSIQDKAKLQSVCCVSDKHSGSAHPASSLSSDSPDTESLHEFEGATEVSSGKSDTFDPQRNTATEDIKRAPKFSKSILAFRPNNAGAMGGEKEIDPEKPETKGRITEMNTRYVEQPYCDCEDGCEDSCVCHQYGARCNALCLCEAESPSCKARADLFNRLFGTETHYLRPCAAQYFINRRFYSRPLHQVWEDLKDKLHSTAHFDPEEYFASAWGHEAEAFLFAENTTGTTTTTTTTTRRHEGPVFWQITMRHVIGLRPDVGFARAAAIQKKDIYFCFCENKWTTQRGVEFCVECKKCRQIGDWHCGHCEKCVRKAETEVPICPGCGGESSSGRKEKTMAPVNTQQ